MVFCSVVVCLLNSFLSFMNNTVITFLNLLIKKFSYCDYPSVGKPARRLSALELQDPNYLEIVFRDACSWMSFTFNRDIIDWKYEVLIRKYMYLISRELFLFMNTT